MDKENEIVLFARKWVELKTMMLRKISKLKKPNITFSLTHRI
jgi:hypothetical protein